jgi:hypothetical protein
MSSESPSEREISIRYRRDEAALRVRQALRARLQGDASLGRDVYRSAWWAPFGRAVALAHRALVLLCEAEVAWGRHSRGCRERAGQDAPLPDGRSRGADPGGDP